MKYRLTYNEYGKPGWVYEVTDDYKRERLVWKSTSSVIDHGWEDYIARATANRFRKIEWITKEEVFLICL